MSSAVLINQIYDILNLGVVLNLAKDGIGVLMKKKLSDAEKMRIQAFIQDNRDFILEILDLNHGTLSSETGIVKTNLEYAPLSFAQGRLWFIEEFEGGSDAYNVPLVYELSNEISIPFLESSLRGIMERHEILRTIIRKTSDGVAYQMPLSIHEAKLAIPHIVVSTEAELRDELKRAVNYVYDLTKECPLRATLYSILHGTLSKRFLAIVIHHIAFDGWSSGLFLRELVQHYQYFSNEAKHPKDSSLELPILPIQYKDFAVWQQHVLSGPRLEEQLGYWRETLSGYSDIHLASDHPRPKEMDYRGCDLHFIVDSDTTQGLRMLAEELKVSLFTVLLAGYYLILKIYSGQDDIVIGSPVSNRHYPQIENLIGFFVNTLTYRIETKGSDTIRDFICELGKQVISSQIYQDLPFEKLVDELKVQKDLSRNPIFQVMFALQNFLSGFGDKSRDDSDLIMHFKPYQNIYTAAKFDMSLYMQESGEILDATLNYATSLFEESSMQRIIASLLSVLRQFSRLVTKRKTDQNSFNLQLREIRVLEQHSFDKIVYEWNKTEKYYAEDKTLHSLFEDQVFHTPNHTAIICNDASLTYRELNQRANQLAHYLCKTSEIIPDSRIVLFLDRTIEMLVAILAVLKSGAAYVPIDPSYPDERIAYVLNDSGAEILLTNQHHSQRINFISKTDLVLKEKTILAIDSQDTLETLKLMDSSNLAVPMSSRSLAYIIYTSGTTGKPKGVMVEHKSVLNTLQALNDVYDFKKNNKATAFTSYVFDVSVSEFFMPLIRGAELHLFSEDLKRDTEAISQYLLKYEIGYTYLPPALLALLPRKQYPDLEVIVYAGEKCDQETGVYWSEHYRLYNYYGPTEATIYATGKQIIAGDTEVIGKPIQNVTAYVLDVDLNPLPVGAIGDLYIGGVGLARGYLNQESLTQEKFIPNPFQTDLEKQHQKNTRLYRTGDKARWRPQGDLEFIGRTDKQVKIRGFRVELGEIENAVRTYPGIKQCTVLLKEYQEECEANRNKYLAAYYVQDINLREGDELSFLDNWSKIFQSVYTGFDNFDYRSNFSGWNSSYDGTAIPRLEMEEWLNNTLERIKECAPRVVLELGSGTGLILFNLIDDCDHYYASDISKNVVYHMQAVLNSQGYADKVEVFHCEAKQFPFAKLKKHFDTIILNSVVQYFPSQEYLLELIAILVLEMRVSGQIYIGDVRDYRLINCFHFDVLKSKKQLVRRHDVDYVAKRDKELLVSPLFFYYLKTLHPEISEVRVMPKLGRAYNEMNCFRYDVVLFIKKSKKSQERAPEEIKELKKIYEINHAQFENVFNFKAYLEKKQSKVVQVRIPRKNIAAPYIESERIYGREINLDVQNLLEIPEIIDLSKRLGFNAELFLDPFNPLYLNIVFYKNSQKMRFIYNVPAVYSKEYCNEPLITAKLLDKQEVNLLRAYLGTLLPDYMIPTVLLRLEALPLTVNGKLDQKALPEPNFLVGDGFVAPRNNLERAITKIWSEILVLPVNEIGIRDDFFRLGGDSIISIQLVSRLRQRLGLQISVKDIFSFKTIEKLYDNMIARSAQGRKTQLRTEQGILIGELPLLPIQKWFFDCNYPVRSHWNQSVLIRVPQLDSVTLKNAVAKLLLQHDAFRLRFSMREDASILQYYQEIDSPKCPEVLIFDIRAMSSKEGSEEFQDELHCHLTSWQSGFDLELGPMHCIAYLHGYADKSARLFIAAHHLIIDAVSLRIIIQDLQDLYEGRELGNKGTSYRQWGMYLKEYKQQHAEELLYWRDLENDSAQQMDRFLPFRESKDETKIIQLQIDEKKTKQLLHECHGAYNTQMNDLLLTALGLALYDISGSYSTSIVLEAHGREEIEPSIDLTRTLGWFTSMYIVKLSVSEDLAKTIKDIKENLRNIPNNGLGYGILNGYHLNRMPQICFNYLGQMNSGDETTGSNNWSIVKESSGNSIHPENIDLNLLNINGLLLDNSLQFSISSKLTLEKSLQFVETFKKRLEEIIAYTASLPRSYLTISDIDKLISQERLDALQSEIEIQEIYKANSLQQGFIYHALNQSTADDAYMVQICWQYTKPIFLTYLKQAWLEVLKIYPALRLRFDWEEEFIQIIDKEGSLDWRYIDLRQDCDKAKNNFILEIAEQDRIERYDLRKGKLFRIYILQASDAICTFLFSNHHAILDGWSMPILFNAVHENYLKLLNGVTISQWLDEGYSAAQKYIQQHEESHKAFWQSYIAQIEGKIDLRGIISDSANIRLNEYRHIVDQQEQVLKLEELQLKKLKVLAQEIGITINTILQYAWHKALSVYGMNQQTVVGMVVSGRELPIDNIEKSLGLYINTLPVIVNHVNESITEALQRLHETISDINARSNISLVKLQKDGIRLFDSLFIFENYPAPNGSLTEDHFGIQYVGSFDKLDYPLAVVAYELASGLHFKLKYEGKIFNKETILALLAFIERLINQIIDSPKKSTSEFDYLSSDETKSILYDLNVTRKEYPNDKTLHSLFEAEVRKSPDSIALIHGHNSLTYGELNRLANQLAHYLKNKHKVTLDTPIALYLERGLEMLIGILATLKSGGYYIPIEVNSPPKRIQYLLQNSNATLVLTNASHLEGLSKNCIRESITLLGIDSENINEEIVRAPDSNLNIAMKSDALAYIIYTSGTTGKPKGVMQSHGNVMRLFTSTEEWYGFGSQDTWTLFHSYVFDFTIWEIWGALIYGGKLVIPSFDETRDMKSFYKLCLKHGVTVLNQTPGAFYQFMEIAGAENLPLPCLKYVIFGGEALNLIQLKPWFERFGYDKPKLINMYGITETTVHVTYKPITEKDIGPKSYIGRGLPDLKLYVLNENLKPLPFLAPGELYVGGAGLAVGYLNNQELTKERFIPNPYQLPSEKMLGQNSRLYKTGDIVRLLPNLELEYIGRVDTQVKIRGFRIELGEIEAAISSFEGIKQSVVLMHENKAVDSVKDDEKNNVTYGSLAGYYVATHDIMEDELLQFLKSKLPDYMIPSYFFQLQALPLTLNGKLDRTALPKPLLGKTSNYTAPRTQLEHTLCDLWSKVLGTSFFIIGIHDNFFRLGGDSLLAIRLISKINSRLITDLKVKDIFEHRTIAQLAAFLEVTFENAKVAQDSNSRSIQSTRIKPYETFSLLPKEKLAELNLELLEDAYPASYLQLGMLLETQLTGKKTYQNIICFEVKGGFEQEKFLAVWKHISQRHELLRACFLYDENRGFDVAIYKEIKLDFSLYQHQDIDRLFGVTNLREFDYWRPGLFRLVVNDLGKSFHLIFQSHHAIEDGWSIASLINEFSKAYLQGIVNQSTIALRFGQFVRDEQLAIQDEDTLNFWKNYLADYEITKTKWKFCDTRSDDSLYVKRYAIPQTQLLLIEKITRKYEITVDNLFLLCLFRTLSFLLNKEDIIIGLVCNNRFEEEGGDEFFGLFLNTIPLRLKKPVQTNDGAELQNLFNQRIALQKYKKLPYGHLKSMIGEDLFEFVFNFTHFHVLNDTVSSITPITSYERTNIPFVMNLSQNFDNSFLIVIQAHDDFVDEPFLEYFLQYFKQTLHDLLNENNRYPWLLAEDEKTLLVEYNKTDTAFDSTGTIHGLFEEQVERSPDKTALIFEDSQLSYSKLNEASNQLAHYLVQNCGLKPGDRIGVCLDRSLEMLTAIFATLKVGAAYVAIDPSYPDARIAYMLQDSKANLALISSNMDARFHALKETPPGFEFNHLCVDSQELHKKVASLSKMNLSLSVKSESLAYVMYTSGTTGNPKGVMCHHKGIVNRIQWMNNECPLQPSDRILQKTPFVFDVSVWELFWGSWHGATLIMAKPDGHKDPTYLIDIIEKKEITILHFVPSMLRIFEEALESRIGPLESDASQFIQKLRYVFCSGEALELPEVAKFKKLLPLTQIYNLYGPTEASIDVLFKNCSGVTLQKVTLGKPIANTKAYVLDKSLNPLPIAAIGELYIGGVGLATGYINNLALTQERFIPNPFQTNDDKSLGQNSHLYKTGDLACWLPNGELEYHGRCDSQIKIRGLRIELGEIEAKMKAHSGIKDAIVVYDKREQDGAMLTAYIIPDKNSATPVANIINRNSTNIDGQEQENLLTLENIEIYSLNKSESLFLFDEIFHNSEYIVDDIVIEEGATVIDAGANIGMFSLYMGLYYENITLYAIEPIPPIYEILKKNLETYEINATCKPVALGEKDSFEDFTYYPNASILSGKFADIKEEKETIKHYFLNETGALDESSGLSALQGLNDETFDEFLSERLNQEVYRCQVITLSELITQHEIKKIDLLKIDTEKSEFEILKGVDAADWPKIKQIILEVHDSNGMLRQSCEFLQKHGFDVRFTQQAKLQSTNLYTVYGKRSDYYRDRVISKQAGLLNKNMSHLQKYRFCSRARLLESLEQDLVKSLPSYMIPNNYVFIDKIPLTINGKLDKKALPNPNQKHNNQIPPENALDRTMVEIWSHVLGMKPTSFGIQDDFFRLGGNSILAIRLAAKINNELNKEIRAATIFKYPNIRSFVNYLESHQKQTPVLKAEKMQGEKWRLSFAEERLWFIEKYEGGTDIYNVPMVFKLDETHDLDVLIESLQRIVSRHEILRSLIEEDHDGNPYRIILDPSNVISINRIEINLFQFNEMLQNEMEHIFDFSKECPLRVTIYHVSQNGTYQRYLCILIHHIAFDGWSTGIFLNELHFHYLNLIGQEKVSQFALPNLPQQYKNFADWQRNFLAGSELDRQLTYWKNKLIDAEYYTLPTDFPRPEKLDYRGTNFSFVIEEQLADKLKLISKKLKVSLFAVLLSGYFLLQRAFSNQNDIVLGTPIANRDHKETENLIGLFVNTLILRQKINARETLRGFIETISRELAEAQEHQDLPFEMLVSELDVPKDTSRNPIFQVMFGFQEFHHSNQKDNAANISFKEDLALEPYVVSSSVVAKFDLSTFIEWNEARLHGIFNYAKSLFKESTIVEMADAYLLILSQIALMVHDEKSLEEYRICDLNYIEGARLEKIVYQWNDTGHAYPRGKTIHKMFEEVARTVPNKPALITESGILSYEALDGKSNRLANYLLSFGLTQLLETRIAFCLDRTEDLVVSLLAILKVGAVYVPIDPNYPDQRIAFLLQDSGSNLVLTNEHFKERIKGINNNVTLLSVDNSRVIKEISKSDAILLSDTKQITADALAYVIYTSGSTGNPKGVMVSHKAVVSLATADFVDINERDTGILLSDIAFDAATFELWNILLNRAALLLIKDHKKLVSDAVKLREVLRAHQVTVLWLTKSLFDVLYLSDKSLFKDLKYLLVGGEALNKDLITRLFLSEHAPENIINGYGPTENTTFSCTFRLENPDALKGNSIPIGRPLSNRKAYVLNESGKPLPIGAVGELYVAGEGLARGYLNQEALTKERFIVNSFQTEAERKLGTRSLLYKTGDRVRFLATGDIEFIGRSDSQIKLQGYRIELGEIETALLNYTGIKQAVVLLKEAVNTSEEKLSQKYLVAYYSAKQKLDGEKIRKFLQDKLPQHMVPALLLELETFPLLPSGKVDRKALDALEIQDISSSYQPPRDELEQLICKIWQEVLPEKKSIGVRESFFRLGGNSILSIKIIAKLNKALDMGLNPYHLFKYSTVESLAQYLRGDLKKQQQSHISVKQVPEEEQLLSFAQERLWFIELYAGKSNAYNVPLIFELREAIGLDILQNIIKHIVQRHEILRTIIINGNNGAYQKVLAVDDLVNILHFDLKEVKNKKELEIALRFDSNTIFSLGEECPMLITFYKVVADDEKFYLSIVLHHIIFDGWSTSLLIKEFETLYEYYRQESKTNSFPLAPLSIQYKDFALWQREYLEGPRGNEQLTYWKNKLNSYSELNLPVDYPRPKEFDYTGNDVFFELEDDLSKVLRQLAARLEVSLYSLLLSAFALLLRAYSHQDDIIIGTPIANRHYRETENLIGFFVNTLALRIEMDSEMSIENTIKLVSQEVISAQLHQDIPFEKLVHELQIPKDTSKHPIYQVIFRMENSEEPVIYKENAILKNYESGSSLYSIAKFDLTLLMENGDKNLRGTFNYARALFSEQTIYGYIHTLKLILEQFAQINVNNALLHHKKIADLSYLTLDAQTEIIYTWNSVPSKETIDESISKRFEAALEKAPESIALIYEGTSLNYKALNERSNQLAHYLASMGVQSETLIAIMMGSTLHFVIAAFAVLKCGAAYVPLDADSPDSRLQYILEDTKAAIILADNITLDSIPASFARLICLDEASKKINQFPKINPTWHIESSQLAYVIYTSGTTGQPKGVMVENKAVVNFACNNNYCNLDQSTITLGYSNYAFDGSVFDIFSTLLNLGKLVLINKNNALDGDFIRKLIAEHSINTIFITTALFSHYAGLQEKNPLLGIKNILFGGEKVNSAAIESYLNFGNNNITHVYGPTENVVFSSFCPITRDNYKIAPIGKRLLDKELYVLNADLKPVPIAAIGELYIGGTGQARGYLNKPALTQEKFLKNPFNPNSKIYRTGDLVRFLPNGNLQYIGRNDSQVKIRGFRIELGEIEAALLNYPGIKQCTVQVKERTQTEIDFTDTKFLVGYFTSEENLEDVLIKSYLSSKLPDYMQPSFLIQLKEIPLTKNGKINKALLPDPEVTQKIDSLRPRNPLEERAVEVWSEVLGLMVHQIGIQDDFFMLGGNSILAIKLVNKMRLELHLDLNIVDLFRDKTIEKLLQRATAIHAETSSIKYEEFNV